MIRNFGTAVSSIVFCFIPMAVQADILTAADVNAMKAENVQPSKTDSTVKAKSDGPVISGEGRLRFEDQARTSSFSSSQTFYSFRLRPTVKWALESGVEVVLEPQFSKRLGAETYVPGATTNSLTESSGNSGFTGDPMTVYQAYLKAPIGDALSVKAGRMALKYGADLIVGPASWGLYGRSFDAVVLNAKLGTVSMDLLQAKIADFGSHTAGGDRDLNGVYVTWKPDAWIKALELYNFERLDLDNKTTASADDGNRNRYAVTGLRLLNEWDGYKLGLEYAGGSGSSNFVGDGTDAAMMFVNFETPSYAGHKIGVDYASAGANWNEMYPTTNKYLGRADVIGRRNILSQTVTLKSDWTDVWGTELSFFNFQRKSTSKKIYGTNGTSSFGSAVSTSNNVGTEIDLVVSYKYDKATTWSAGASTFAPGSYLKETLDEAGTTGPREAHFAYLMLETKF